MVKRPIYVYFLYNHVFTTQSIFNCYFCLLKAFSKKDRRGNPLQTIKAKQATREEEIGRVYLKELSFTDVKIVNRMYNCAGRYI